MSKIIAFGCSLTAQHRWKYINNRTVESYAISSGSIDMSQHIYSNLLLRNKINSDDIILFQLTHFNRHSVVTSGNVRLNDIHTISQEERTGFVSLNNSYDYERIDLTDFTWAGKQGKLDWQHPNHDKVWNTLQNVSTKILKLESTIPFLMGVKSYNPKLLVLHGWEKSAGDHAKKFNHNLEKFGIDYIPQSIRGWCAENGNLIVDDRHPSQDGYREFTHRVLEPKLAELGW